MTRFTHRGRLYDITFASTIIHDGVSLELTEISGETVTDVMLAFRSDRNHSIVVHVFEPEIPLKVVNAFLAKVNAELDEAIMIKQETVYPLQNVLVHADSLPWQLDLFIERDGSISGVTRAAIINTEEYDDADESPFAHDHGLHYAVTVSAVQDIVSNARQQRPGCGSVELVKAFVYYYRNDAFIDFGSNV